MFHKVLIPVTLCIVIIMMYILVGAVMFHKWEDWDLVSSAYFCFITLTTVKITTTSIIIIITLTTLDTFSSASPGTSIPSLKL